MKSERRQVGGRYLAKARGAFLSHDVRSPRKVVPDQTKARRRDTGGVCANAANRASGPPATGLPGDFQGPVWRCGGRG